MRGRSVAAFDLNAGERTLAQFLPEKTTIATVRDINGQMALFDRLIADEDTTKVIDLGHESFEAFFSVAAPDRVCRGSATPFGCRGNPIYGDARPDVG